MRRFLAITLTTTAALAATGGVAWAFYDRPAGAASDCEGTDHGTTADADQMLTGLTAPARTALGAARQAAARTGLTLTVNSGYRSPAYQQRVFDCWVAQTGSEASARLHALPPNESAHVAGIAVDIVPPSAAAWLEKTGGAYGLCRRYENEPWHFEYRASYKRSGCPSLLAHP